MRYPSLLAVFCVVVSSLTMPARAVLNSQSLQGSQGTTNLVDSRLTIQVGPQWLDIEEEAELQVVPRWGDASGQWIVEGFFNVPRGTAITGCMLWNDDTLLMGKLRGKQDAQKIFDSLVPPRNPAWARDPLLVEQITETTYGLKLFPFAANGTRRFRLRYLVPRQAGESDVAITPLMATSMTGTVPSAFRLRLRGTDRGLKLVKDGGVWPLDLPSSERMELGSRIFVRWPNAEATKAVRGQQESGAWAGDFVSYEGGIPDTIRSRIGLRSETVVLWHWSNPDKFVTSCDYYSGQSCLTTSGNQAIYQAERIRLLGSYLVGNGNRFGLVADENLGEDPRVFGLGDSSSSSWRSAQAWLQGVNEAYLQANIPISNSSAPGVPSSVDVSRSRDRFRVDVREVATLYSRDSGIVRHLVVVTAGVAATGASLESVDPSLLPEGISVTTSTMYPGWSRWDYATQSYVLYPSPETFWSGVDLAGWSRERSGGARLDAWYGIAVPRVKTSFAARLSISAEGGRIARRALVQKDAEGRLRAQFNAHGRSLGTSVQWEIYGDSGEVLQSWEDNPSWVDVGSDSVFPRIWAKSDMPLSKSFEDKDLGPIFGFVDPFHSLLATPSDTVGVERQEALRDSGVPFLTWREIFPRQGFGGENDGGGDPGTNAVGRRETSRQALQMAWLPAQRALRIQLEGLNAQEIIIRDLRGRVLAILPAGLLAGKTSFDWKVPGHLHSGLLLVSVRTPTGDITGRMMIH